MTVRGGFRHVLVATSLPFLLPMGLHHVEAWDEAISLGGRHGYRNAQASVLAPTGTIGLAFTGLAPATKYLGSVAYTGASGMPNPTIVGPHMIAGAPVTRCITEALP